MAPLGETYCTFPIIHASLLVAISTNDDGVQVNKTKRSATDKFKRNKFVELLKTFEVNMTTITNKFPEIQVRGTFYRTIYKRT